MKRWYVLQVYAGYEESVKADLMRRAQEEGFQEYFGEVLIPSARLKHYFDADEVKEVERILSQMRGEVIVSSEKSDFVVGREVEIKEGPFTGFVGIIDKVDEESERLTVMVSIFGRMTPVELSFNQIKH